MPVQLRVPGIVDRSVSIRDVKAECAGEQQFGVVAGTNYRINAYSKDHQRATAKSFNSGDEPFYEFDGNNGSLFGTHTVPDWMFFHNARYKDITPSQHQK